MATFILALYMLFVFMTVAVMILKDEKTSTGLKVSSLIFVVFPVLYLILTIIFSRVVFI